MATFDPQTQTLTLRIVFDGLGMAGKTTNLRQIFEILSSSKRGDLYVPEERRGRTLYFDWLEVEAGVMGEHRVRCQLLTVPGQFSYVQRRWHLLGSPDAIVVVIDSTPQGLVRARYALRFLQEAIANHTPPVPLIVQANKQDLEGALPGHEVAREMDLPSKTRVVEVSAIQGAGVRATLVFALQAARERLQRVLAEQGLDALPVGTETAEEVYRQLLRQETEGVEAKEGEILADRVLYQLEATPLPPPAQGDATPGSSGPPPAPPGSSGPTPAPSSAPASATPTAFSVAPGAAPSGGPPLASSGAPASTGGAALPAPAEPSSGSAATPAPSAVGGAPLLVWPAVGARVDLQEAQQAGAWALHGEHAGEDPLTELRNSAWSLLYQPSKIYQDRQQGALALRELAEARLAAGDLLPAPWNLLLRQAEGGLQLCILRRTLEPAFPAELGGSELTETWESLVTYVARALTLAARHGIVLTLDPARLGRGPHGLVCPGFPAPISRWGTAALAPLVQWCAKAAPGLAIEPHDFARVIAQRVADPEDLIRLDWLKLVGMAGWP